MVYQYHALNYCRPFLVLSGVKNDLKLMDMDFVNALRMSEDMEDIIPEYDTQSDDVVFIPNDPEEVDPFEELPF